VSQNPASPAGNLAVLAALAACLSTALGGSAFVAIRFLVTETEPVTIAFLRNFVAAVVLTAIALLVVRRWPTPRELLVMGAMGALFFGGLQFIFSNALIYTTSSRGALAYTTAPFMTLLIAAAFGIEAPPGAWIGDGLILVGALITAVYGVWSSRALKRHSPLVAVVTGVVPGSFLLYLFAMASGAPAFTPDLSPTGWAAMAFLGIGAAVISYSRWRWALQNTTPILVAVALPMNPLMALVWGAVLLGENVTPEMIAGFVLVITGIAAANWPRRRVAA